MLTKTALAILFSSPVLALSLRHNSALNIAGGLSVELNHTKAEASFADQSWGIRPVAKSLDLEFDLFLEVWFEDFMARRPLDALSFGRKLRGCGVKGARSASANPIWGDSTRSGEDASIAKDEQQLAELERRFGQTIGARPFSDERRLTLLVMREKVAEMRQEHAHGDFRLPFGSLGCKVGVMGCQVRVVDALRAFEVETEEDGHCFVSLLAGVLEYLHGHEGRLRDSAARGVVPYKPVLEGIKGDCEQMLPAEKVDGGASDPDPTVSEFYHTFADKLKAAERLPEGTRKRLLRSAAQAVRTGVWPAYRSLRDLADALLLDAPDGDKGVAATYGNAGKTAYAKRLELLGIKQNATEVHAHALKLVEANKLSMRKLAVEAMGTKASQEAPFPKVLSMLKASLYDDHYPNTEDGRSAYLKQIQGYISSMWSVLDTAGSAHDPLFAAEDVPALACDVGRIWAPSFPASAQYTAGTLAVGVPGSLAAVREKHASVNFKVTNMSDLPKAEMQALAYHEVVPGHHLQVTRTLALQGKLPSFRRFFGDEAFSEGWAVYAEQDLSRRLVHTTASAELGLLNMLQLRAIRTVVDTGLHSMDWDREQARSYYHANSLVAASKADDFIVRHLAWPGQQLSYLVGYERVREVRESLAAMPGLREGLGRRWEAALHGALVSHGDLPLALLDGVVRADLASQLHAAHA